jgi:transglutaminase/protease-like cytokinesis protein 3
MKINFPAAMQKKLVLFVCLVLLSGCATKPQPRAVKKTTSPSAAQQQIKTPMAQQRKPMDYHNVGVDNKRPGYFVDTKDGFNIDVSYGVNGEKIVDVYYDGGKHVIAKYDGRKEFGGFSTGEEAVVPYKQYDAFIDAWQNRLATDREFSDLIKLCKTVADRYTYDWDWYLNKTPSRDRTGRAGAGLFICDDYASAVKNFLTQAGYPTKIVSSSQANHAWNEVTLPSGRVVYVDVTWFDSDRDENHNRKEQDYTVQWITFDRNQFTYGISGKIKSHYAYGDALEK